MVLLSRHTWPSRGDDGARTESAFPIVTLKLPSEDQFMIVSHMISPPVNMLLGSQQSPVFAEYPTKNSRTFE